MNSHETGDSNNDRPQPEHERLPDYEIDLTGVVAQNESRTMAIGDAIVKAGPGGEVPEWGARVMARYLANRLAEPASALHHFAVTGRADYEGIGNELAMLWEAPRDDLVTEVINRLGTYFIATYRTAQQEAEASYSDETRALIEQLGPPFVAFLTLPDVTEANASETFHESYFGSFASLEEIAQHVGETHEVWRLLDDASLSHLASPDLRLLIKLAQERWDSVHHEDHYYLFEK